MKQFLLIIFLLFVGWLHAQEAQQSFRLSDSLYRVKDFKGSAMATMAGIRAEKEKDLPIRYLNAARAFSLAGLPDSAFMALKALETSSRISVYAVRNMAISQEFQSLRQDKRWSGTLEKILRKSENNYHVEELIYGHKEGLALTMLALSPIGTPNGKAIIRVVAGSWYSSLGSAESYVMSSYDYLAKGFKVFHAMVGSNPRYNIQEQIEDVKRAVRYVRYNAARLGVDPDKIGIEGGSAGGHLSLAVATSDDVVDEKAVDPVDRVSSRVQAVAVLYPPTDFLNWGGKGNNMANARPLLELNKVWGAMDFRTLNEQNMTYVPVSDTAARNRIAMKISPASAVTPDDPPVFIMHGDADPTVPIQQSYWIVDRFKEAGVVHRFIVKLGGKHNPQDMMPEWMEAVDWFAKFLQ